MKQYLELNIDTSDETYIPNTSQINREPCEQYEQTQFKVIARLCSSAEMKGSDTALHENIHINNYLQCIFL